MTIQVTFRYQLRYIGRTLFFNYDHYNTIICPPEHYNQSDGIWNIIKDILLQTYQRRLEDYVKLILFAKKISTSINLSCILSLNVIGETEKSILEQNGKTPSILLEHGFTNYVPELSKFDISNMYSLFKDKIALWGNIQKEYLINQHSIPEERILMVGSSRHDAFFKKNSCHETSKKTVLITPGQFDEPNAVYDTNSFMKYEILFKKLFSIIKQIPDVSIIVKLHPSQQKNNLSFWGTTQINPEYQSITILPNDFKKIIDGCKQIIKNYKPSINIDPNWEMIDLNQVCYFKFTLIYLMYN